MFFRNCFHSIQKLSRAQLFSQIKARESRKFWWRNQVKTFATSQNKNDDKPDSLTDYKGNNDFVGKYAAKIVREPTFLDCFMTNHAEYDDNEPLKVSAPKKKLENDVILIPEVPQNSIQVKLRKAFKLYNIRNGPSTNVQLTKEDAHNYYRQMQTIRHLEVASGALYKENVIRGFCHLYSGQEACAVGIKAAMREHDNVITAHRCHGWCYMMNTPSVGILTELTGRRTGCQRGKGGSMHLYSSHFYGGNGIVGAQVPLGTGIGLSCKYKRDGSVCFVVYGECAANQGQIFESFNTASAWKLPVIFVCENNSTDSWSCSKNYYTRGNVLPGIWVDGANVLAVRSAAAFAIDFVGKNGPLIVEVSTRRSASNSKVPHPLSCRERGAIPQVQCRRDPILDFKKLCREKGLLNKADIKSINEMIYQEINEAVTKSITDPTIEVNELTSDIYSKNLESEVRCTTGYTLPMKHHEKIAKVNQ